MQSGINFGTNKPDFSLSAALILMCACVYKFRNINIYWQAMKLSKVIAQSSSVWSDRWRCRIALHVLLLYLKTVCT